MTQESEITLRDGRVEFRIFIYTDNLDNGPVGTIEGMVSADNGRLLELAFTDAISARTSKLNL